MKENILIFFGGIISGIFLLIIWIHYMWMQSDQDQPFLYNIKDFLERIYKLITGQIPWNSDNED